MNSLFEEISLLLTLSADLDIQGFIEVAAGHDIHYDRSDSFMHYNRQSGPWDKLNIKAEDSLEVTDALCTPRCSSFLLDD